MMLILRYLLKIVNYPRAYFKMNNSRRTRILIVHEGEVLLTDEIVTPGKLCLPGGGIKPGEQDKAGAIRELEEELGLVVKPNQLTRLGDAPVKEDRWITYTGVFFTLRVDKKPKLKLQKTEIVTVRWHKLVDLPENLSNEVIVGVSFVAK